MDSLKLSWPREPERENSSGNDTDVEKGLEDGEVHAGAHICSKRSCSCQADLKLWPLRHDEQTQITVETCYESSEEDLSSTQLSQSPMLDPVVPRSLLHRAAVGRQITAFAVFGGQGSDANLLDELRSLYRTQAPLIGRLVRSASENLRQLANDVRFVDQYPHGFDLITWLDDETASPEKTQVDAAAVSMPLIGLLQLLHYRILGHELATSPDDMHQILAGTTGHSQGIIAAAVIASVQTWQRFEARALDAVIILQAIGARASQVFPTPPTSTMPDAGEMDEQRPTPMLSIRNLPLKDVQNAVDEANQYLGGARIEIALINGPRAFVVSGSPTALHFLRARLRVSKPQSRVDTPKSASAGRAPTAQFRFLPISAPFHSSHLKRALELVTQDIKHVPMPASELAIPLYSTADGQDLRAMGSRDLGARLADLVLVQRLDWEAASQFHGATTVLDFGPGGIGGAGGLIHANKEGTGVRVILASLQEGHRPEFGYRPSLVGMEPIVESLVCRSWAHAYGPQLVRTNHDRTIVDTRFSRLLGLPPVMVAGMTPTTAHAGMVVAIMKAGYHVELAAGGFYSSGALTAAVQEIVREVGPGRGLAINVIYANPLALRWQISTIAQLRAEGYPVDGLTIGAGVPSLDVASEYITGLGLRYIGFKPGSVTAIQQVLAIAKMHPEFPIVLQWTGGRGGGHHSPEDFHQPLVEMYGRIRECANVSLVVGSGLGDAADSYPYISGEWSQKLGHAAMPCDGILLGSRMLVAREARTSFAAKQAIVAAAGTTDDEWERTYQRPAGGVLTVKSEMNEPIHKLATRLVCFWHELDHSLFKLTKKEMLKQLQSRRQYIIEKLNSDCHKVWFGKAAAGGTPDVDGMTYKELIDRLVELTFVSHQNRWIDASFQVLAEDVMTMVQSRFAATPKHVSITADPRETAGQLCCQFPAMAGQLVTYKDTRRFIEMCRRRGQKPVPFIPVLDESFETWFKKDSLWQSEDLEAVVDQDVGRVCILQGPVAARYSTNANQSAQEILDDIHTDYVRALTRRLYHGQTGKVPFVECFGLASHATERTLTPSQVEDSEIGLLTTYSFDATKVPSLDAFLTSLGGSHRAWCHAFFTAVNIVQGSKLRPNPARQLFQPTPNTSVQICESRKSQVSIKLFDNAAGGPSKVTEVTSAGDGIIHLQILDHGGRRAAAPASLHLRYAYQPEFPLAPLRELTAGRNERIKDFYRQLWLTGDEARLSEQSTIAPFSSSPVTVSGDDIAAFTKCVGNHNGSFTWQSTGKITAPMDYAIVLAWKVLVGPLLAKDLDCDLLRLVHLSNRFELVDGAAPICAGDVVSATGRVTAILNQASGKRVRVEAEVMRDARPVVKIRSEFFVRGATGDALEGFETLERPPMEVSLESAQDVAVLMSKSWFQPRSDAPNLRGCKVRFTARGTVRFDARDAIHGVSVNGDVQLVRPHSPPIAVGHVAFNDPTACHDPVAAYLTQHGTAAEGAQTLPYAVPITGDACIRIRAPPSNRPYQMVSGDTNPIHTSPLLARYAELPGTITHGMHTSAMVRALVEQRVCGDDVGRFREFSATFTDMVLPGDVLEVTFEHTAMRKGRKLITVRATKAGTQQIVLQGEATVDSPRTAYIFTGQGSQCQGMGMDLYAESAAARRVWDYADAYFRPTYGFSILDIVRNNPKELIVRFGGAKGRIVRQNYRRLQLHEQGVSKQLLPSITSESDSYRFYHPEGLLFATQFTQPALTIMEKAIFEDLRARGLVPEHSSFAGHSLGEYAALCSLGGGALTLESMVEMVFYRGMSMHMTVQRDARGNSDFAMCAVDPSRVGPGFNEVALNAVVQTISKAHGTLLEIVNYNIRDTQYVCTGDIRSIACMTHVLDNSARTKANLGALLEAGGEQAVRLHVEKLVAEWGRLPVAQSKERISLKRGKATIPLKGVDVPFHSSFLRPGVDSFRGVLEGAIKSGNIEPHKLCGRYVPNLTAKPFEVNKDYFALTLERTGSKVLQTVLNQWDELILGSGFEIPALVAASA